jgi:AraC-like DNA-binding protein/mannose-6-phosphate isomerase-like protein (cupin superfamily)
MTNRVRDSSGLTTADLLLRDLRVSSTLFCRTEFGAPWGFGVHAHGKAAFHVVTDGECWLEVADEPEPMHLRSGDIAILPHGPTHWLRDDLESPTLWLEDLLDQDRVTPDLRLTSGGGGARAHLICGAFTVDGSTQHPVLSALPKVIYVRRTDDGPLPWLEPTLDLMRHEIHAAGPGGVALIERLSEVLLSQTLRAALNDPEGETVSLQALRDETIAPAVRAIHEHPEHAWTVGELARLSAMSRSAFATRFRAVTGDSPIRYITRYRLARAARQLRTTSIPIGEIASSVGYESIFSFSRAFKRAFGIPPRGYRDGDDSSDESDRSFSLSTST